MPETMFSATPIDTILPPLAASCCQSKYNSIQNVTAVRFQVIKPQCLAFGFSTPNSILRKQAMQTRSEARACAGLQSSPQGERCVQAATHLCITQYAICQVQSGVHYSAAHPGGVLQTATNC
jgi:hypothetical protein